MSSKKGCLLISAPHLRDPNFDRTVVLVAEHNAEGAFGLVLNRLSGLKVSRLWEALGGMAPDSSPNPPTSGTPSGWASAPTPGFAFLGGPVDVSSVFILHRVPELAPGCGEVVPGVWLGNERELLGRLIERDEEAEEEVPSGSVFDPRFRVYCGYAGWGQDQLDSELRSGSWLVERADAGAIFSVDSEGLWSDRLARQGGVYALLARTPQNPEWN